MHINKFQGQDYWFVDDLVWFHKFKRADIKRNSYALKKELILRIAEEILKNNKLNEAKDN